MIVAGDILEIQEVADLLRVHPRTVMRLARDGTLPGFRVGNQWRFRKSDIEEYIDQQLRHKPENTDDTN